MLYMMIDNTAVSLASGSSVRGRSSAELCWPLKSESRNVWRSPHAKCFVLVNKFIGTVSEYYCICKHMIPLTNSQTKRFFMVAFGCKDTWQMNSLPQQRHQQPFLQAVLFRKLDDVDRCRGSVYSGFQGLEEHVSS